MPNCDGRTAHHRRPGFCFSEPSAFPTPRVWGGLFAYSRRRPRDLLTGKRTARPQEMPLVHRPGACASGAIESPRAMRPLQTLVPSNTILVSVPRKRTTAKYPCGSSGAGNEQQAAMPLTEHLRELRSRLVVRIAVVVGMVDGWIAYPTIFQLLSQPFERRPERRSRCHLTGVTDPFILQLQVAAIAGIVLASPVWLYQLWRFDPRAAQT